MITFLDIDGVCHPHPPREGQLFGGPQMRALDEALCAIDAQVVIISSWREEMPIGELVALLGPVGKFVTGIAPDEPPFTSTPRQEVVEAWLANAEEVDPAWIAIDDHPEWYGRHAHRVVAPDPSVGFTTEDAQELLRRLQQ